MFVLVAVDLDDTDVLFAALVRGGSAGDGRVLAARRGGRRVVPRLHQLEGDRLAVVASLQRRPSPVNTALSSHTAGGL